MANKIKAEIYARGPVAAAINADPILNYVGGIVDDTIPWHMMSNHIVSIVGWGTDGETGKQYWICRNSWVGLRSVSWQVTNIPSRVNTGEKWVSFEY